MFLYVDPNIIVADNNGNGIDKLSKQVYLYYNLGDCYGYYLLASAFADILGDPIVSPWDILPVVPIIRGAGGIITDWHGNDPVKGNSIIASSPDLHPKLLELLNGFADNEDPGDGEKGKLKTGFVQPVRMHGEQNQRG